MTKFDTSIFKGSKSDLAKKFLFVIFGQLLIRFGVAFNFLANFGTGPSTAFCDGLHHLFNIPIHQAVDILNMIICAIVLLFGRRYLNIGTILTAVSGGFFMKLGIMFYNSLNIPQTLVARMLTVVVGLAITYLGNAIFIAMDIGLSTKPALVKTVCAVTSRQYKTIEVILDLSYLAIGFLLHGKIGPTTVISALLGGPCIQFLSEKVKKLTYNFFEHKPVEVKAEVEVEAKE